MNAVDERRNTLSIGEIKNFVYPMAMRYPVARVILFGSYARGDAQVSSDIDLVVDSAGKLHNRKIFALSGDLLLAFPVRVDVYDLLELSEPLYESVMKEGVVIYDATG